jgi:general secretion pathway protein K
VSPRDDRRHERGFALLSVMLVVALLTVVVLELTVAMRLEAAAGRSFRDELVAAHLAEAGIQQALREVSSQAPVQGVDRDGVLTFYRIAPGSTLPQRLPALPRRHVALGGGEFSYTLSDEEARLNLNTASPVRLARLLQALDLERSARDVVVDSVGDWKDADELARVNGAEDDHYLKLPVPYRARNARLQDIAELLQIRGVTRELYAGRDGKPGLAALVTVHGREAVNINTAPAPVLSAFGLSDPEIADIVQTRVRTPYTVVPGRFTGRGLQVGSTTFRVEAEGWIGGARKARILAVVQRRTAAPGRAAGDDLEALGLAVLAWRTEED